MASGITYLLLCSLLPLVSGKDFLDRLHFDSSHQAAQVKQELQGVLSAVLGHGHGVDGAKLTMIRKRLTPLFRALPKNLRGRVSAPVMRYSIQRYFSQQHGWVVKGFEPHATAANINA